MPTFIYHYIKDFFHVHIHYDPSHDSLLHAYYSNVPLSLENPADRKAIAEYYVRFYSRKFSAYITIPSRCFPMQNINSRMFISRGISKLRFLLNEGREILDEAKYCSALVEMEAKSIQKSIRQDFHTQEQQIKDL